MRIDSKKFQIVLYAPDIPGNTGSVGRLCVALDIPLILVGKLGFDLSQKAVRRAGLDYWKYVQIQHFETWADFTDQCSPEDDILFFETGTDQYHYQAPYSENCYLVFGSETKGLPADLLKNQEQVFALPQFSDKIRSINLANAVTAVAYECLFKLN